MKLSLILLFLAILTALATGCNPLQSAPQPTPTPLPPLTPVVLEPNEGIVWIRQFGTKGNDFPFDIAVDSEGNVYVAGYTEGSFLGFTNLGYADAFLRKYDPDGKEIWTVQFGTLAVDYVFSIAIDSLGNIYVVGQTNGALSGQTAGGSYDAFIRKYDSNGTELWTRQFGFDELDRAKDVAIDNEDQIYVLGSMTPPPDPREMRRPKNYIRKYDSDGKEVWTQMFAEGGISGIAVSIDRDIYVVGNISTGEQPRIGADPSQIYVRKYNRNGKEQWVKQFGSNSSDYPAGIEVDASDNIYVGGMAGGSFPGTSEGQGSSSLNAFVRKMDSGQ